MPKRTGPNRPRFPELSFGHIDAAQEAIDDPDLLLDGYFDYREAAYGIETRHLWLLLGPKGSGKTAVLQHIKLKWQGEPDRFFSIWDLSGFPVNDVSEIGTGQSKGASRSQAAWEFVLLLRLLSSLETDNYARSSEPSLDRLLINLSKIGYLSNDWVGSVVKWRLGGLKLDAKIFGLEVARRGEAQASGTSPLDISAHIRDVLERCPSQSRHLIAVDGLDSFFFEKSDEWSSLAGLIQAVNALNRWFRERELPYSFVAAVRSDVFDVLPGPDLNKMKQSAVHLDWNAGGIGRQNSLWQLIQKKVSVKKSDVNVIAHYFGDTRAWSYPDIPTLILDHTRLLPRDLVAALSYFQLEYGGASAIPEENAKRAIRRYCDEYFVGEVFDNLAGILPSEKARSLASFREALRTSPTRTFSFNYMVEELDGELESAEIARLLKQMFETGALGIRNGRYTDFIYRNVGGAGFTRRHDYMLHDALTRAWNRPW